jgi:ABC-type phosphate transport system ATPase subunit
MDHNNDGTRRVSYNHFTRKQNVKLLLRHTEVKDIIKLSGLGKSTMIKKEKKETMSYQPLVHFCLHKMS